jgi:hypothetical protein
MRYDSYEASEHDVGRRIGFIAADELLQPGSISRMVPRIGAKGVDENIDVSETNRSPP